MSKKCDFSGYVTKTDLRCSDGRRIRKDAFVDQDGMTVPLVWQHRRDEPGNVIGHALLENRSDGVYGYCSFNNNPRAIEAKEAVQHGDITCMSIYANRLRQNGNDVVHGMIREVSLVYAGANPGALIDNLSVVHSDGEMQVYDEEADIYTGISFSLSHEEDESSEKSAEEVFDSLNEEQKNLFYATVASFIKEDNESDEGEDDSDAEHSDEEDEDSDVSEEDAQNDDEEESETEHDDAEDDESLEHYGVKGMKWGKHLKAKYPDKSSRPQKRVGGSSTKPSSSKNVNTQATNALSSLTTFSGTQTKINSKKREVTSVMTEHEYPGMTDVMNRVDKGVALLEEQVRQYSSGKINAKTLTDSMLALVDESGGLLALSHKYASDKNREHAAEVSTAAAGYSGTVTNYVLELAELVNIPLTIGESRIPKPKSKKVGSGVKSPARILEHTEQNEEDDESMKKNVFDQANQDKEKNTPYELTHDDFVAAVEQAKRGGSLRDALTDIALEHGIENLEILFPEARALNTTPEMITRDQGWVSKVWNATRKSPFARIKSMSADLTKDEARAKGYIKGKKKIEEQFALLKRVTYPQTIYKKQGMDRDDIIDITSFDVVAWLKAEMRLMLNEELARAVLIGDGRVAGAEDKINETNIRPVWSDDEMYTIRQNVNFGNADETDKANAVIESALRARKNYKGSGSPTLYVGSDVLTTMLLSRDKIGRRLYSTEAELASALRVKEIVEVPLFDDQTREVDGQQMDLLAIIVNLTDYVVGADRGGAVTMFDDFDIDYNRYKYLIETRCSGALAKPYSAIVLETAHVDVAG